jgi:hypothetical protein
MATALVLHQPPATDTGLSSGTDGEPVVALRPVCDGLGIDYSHQQPGHHTSSSGFNLEIPPGEDVRIGGTASGVPLVSPG